MSVISINAYIKNGYDAYIDNKLKDINVFSKSIKLQKTLDNTINRINNIVNIDTERSKRMLKRELIPLLTPPGLKASVRGDFFNKYIKKLMIKSMDPKHNPSVNLKFEQKTKHMPEIADWILQFNNKTYIGYNQLDLWNGGAQLNRASKYILDDTLHKRLNKQNVYIICVVARNYIYKSNNTKADNMIKKGIMSERLMWPNTLIQWMTLLQKG